MGYCLGCALTQVAYGAAALAQQLRAPDYVLHDMLEEAYGAGVTHITHSAHQGYCITQPPIVQHSALTIFRWW
jgi:hypothetical protein